MGDTRLSIRDLDKSFSVPVLRRVTLSVKRGEVHGLVGENGAGKTTLVNILAGLLEKDRGELLIDGAAYEPTRPADAFDAGVSFAAQELSIIGTLSAAENISLRDLPHRNSVISQDVLRKKAQALLQRVGLESVHADTRADDLNLADRQLLEIAKALATDCRLLILDEPTAALTAPQANHLHSIIRDVASSGTSVIYISHRLADVLHVSDTVSVLRDGQVVTTAASDTVSVSDLMEKMTGRSRQDDESRPAQYINTAPALEVDGITTDQLPHAISFTCRRGEIPGIAGLAGSGRSELLQALFGLTPLTGGSVRLCVGSGKTSIKNAPHAVSRGVAYLGEDRQSMGLFSGQSVLTNMMVPGIQGNASVLRLVDRRRERAAGTELVNKIDIRCESVDQDIAQLSGGNQQKALLARWLHCDSDLFLLDEPTRGVDVNTKGAIYEMLHALQSRGKSILIASSEIEELMAVCSRILVLSDRKLVTSFERDQFSEAEILAAAFQEYSGAISRMTHAPNVPMS